MLDASAEGAADALAEAAIDAPNDAAPPCAITLVAADHAVTFTATSNTIGVTSSVRQRAGDYLVVGVNHVGCQLVQGVTDTTGNAYVRLLGPEDSGAAGSLET